MRSLITDFVIPDNRNQNGRDNDPSQNVLGPNLNRSKFLKRILDC